MFLALFLTSLIFTVKYSANIFDKNNVIPKLFQIPGLVDYHLGFSLLFGNFKAFFLSLVFLKSDSYKKALASFNQLPRYCYKNILHLKPFKYLKLS